MKTILSATEWAHLQEVFDVAINLGPEHWADYLKAACSDTPGWRTRLDSPLAAIEQKTSVGAVVGGAATNTVANLRCDPAETLVSRSKLVEARQLLDSALAVSKKSRGEKSVDVAGIELVIGKLQLASHQPREAEASYRQALTIYRASLRATHPSTATALEILGSFLLHEGRKQEATPLLNEALSIRRKTLPAGSPKIRATQGLLAQAQGES